MDGAYACEQMELDLFRGQPWAGRSPRGLTRVALGLIFKAEPLKPRGVASDFELERLGQLQFWPPSGKAPWIYQGAPSLLPLKRGA